MRLIFFYQTTKKIFYALEQGNSRIASPGIYLSHLTDSYPLFAEKEKGILELKTKSSSVDSILPLKHRERTVLSWSLNPPRIIEDEERGTASLDERLEAARKCQAVGYPLGFHFDPIIFDKGWEREYEKTIHSLFQFVDPKRVVWISLGGFDIHPN